MSVKKLKFVVAHDYLTQKGGAERVALELIKIVNPRLVVTSVWNSFNTFSDFQKFTVKESFLKYINLYKNDPRFALPFLAFAWSSFTKIKADVVICSSSGWSHGIRTSRRTKKIVYCHNPARWLYQDEDYLLDRSILIKTIWSIVKKPLIYWDRRAAASADCYIANSTSVAERIKSVYGISPHIVFPPLCIDTGAPLQPISGINDLFYLTVSRSRGYKGTQVVIDAFKQMPELRLVIAGGGNFSDLSKNITAVGRVSDSELRWLYANAVSLISLSKEDFGLTPIEANAFGTPVLLLRAGGFLDSTHEGVSGLFVDERTPESLIAAVKKYPKIWDRELIVKHAKKFSVDEFEKKILSIVENILT